MDGKIKNLRAIAIITLTLASFFLIIFSLTSYLIESIYASNAVVIFHLTSFVGLLGFVTTSSICWLKYYQKRDANIKTTFSVKAIIIFLCFAVLCLVAFLIPINAYGGSIFGVICFFRIIDIATWFSIVTCWMLYCLQVKKHNKLTVKKVRTEPKIYEEVRYMRVAVIVLSIITLISFIVAILPNLLFEIANINIDPKGTFRGIAFFVMLDFLFTLLICWVLYQQKLKQLKMIKEKEEKYQRRILEEQQRKDELDKRVAAGEFETYLQQFENLSKMAAELIPADTGRYGFSKFGGLPLVPTGFRWPHHNECPRQFVAQFDFSEINADGQLKYFPTVGLMYVFVDEDPYEEDACKILFYEQTGKLSVAKKPDYLETVYKEIYLTTKPLKTYPDVSDCPEAAKICKDNPQNGMNEVYETQWNNMDRHFVGGWASYIQEAYFMPEQKNPNDWVLLCQISSNENGDDDGFMWSDAGTLYFYIRKKDLLERKFNNVKLDMQCG